MSSADGAGAGPVSAALTRGVSPVALEDGDTVAGDAQADRALEDFPQLLLQGGLPRRRLLQLALQGGQLGFLEVQLGFL